MCANAVLIPENIEKRSSRRAGLVYLKTCSRKATIMQRLRFLLAHYGTKVVPAFLTILLLAPAPALAFNWVAGWQTVTLLNTGGAPAPIVSSSDSKTKSGGDAGSLTVDMGKISVKTNIRVAEVVELSRQLKLANPVGHETVTITNFFKTQLQNANITYKVWFTPVLTGAGARSATAFNFNKTAGRRLSTFTQNPQNQTQPKQKLLNLNAGLVANGGNYVVHVRIAYTTKRVVNEGTGWDNTVPVGSPHTLSFSGL